MNIKTATVTQLTQFMTKFFDEKELDRASFPVKHPFYGETEMPFSVLVDALTDERQDLSFLRETATIISMFDFNNEPKEKFNEFFGKVASALM
jgi:hypothetical protein